MAYFIKFFLLSTKYKSCHSTKKINMKAVNFFTLLLSCIVLFSSCLTDGGEVVTVVYTQDQLQTLQSTLNLNDELVDYSIKLPRHIANQGASTSTIDNHKALLGRVLFYDNKLSQNDAVNCSSCHAQSLAFSDDVAFSKGFDEEDTKRNSLALGAVVSFEASYDNPGGPRPLFFWDERAASIQEQSTLTIQDNIEMGMSFTELVPKLSTVDYYDVLFTKAFGDNNITENRITDALEEFVNSMVSANSKFDQGVIANNGNSFGNLPNFTAQENLGRELYSLNCSSCHGHDLVSLSKASANNGLDVVYEDKGRYQVTQFNQDKGVFKVPVLRNIELTGPYMHDGRFASLEEVVDHYSDNVQAHPNLDSELRENFNGSPKRMNFTDNEKEALVDFLKTLTDHEFIAEAKFNNPFK